jgi:hypothetical protein
VSSTLNDDLKRLVGHWPMRHRSRNTLPDHGEKGPPASEARAIDKSKSMPHTTQETTGVLKTCLVIFPVASLVRKTSIRSDQVLQYIIDPAVHNQGYDKPVRSDYLPNPELITHQFIGHLIDDTLVIADLSEADPNVFYGLAVRHASRKPVIQIVEYGRPLPFDIDQSRIIQFDLRSQTSIENCRDEMQRQIIKAERDRNQSYNPIANAINIMNWWQSEDQVLQSQAEILSSLQNLTESVQSMLQRRHIRLSSDQFSATMSHLSAIRTAVAERGDAGLTRTDLEWLVRMIDIIEMDLYSISQELNLQVPSPSSANRRILAE